MKCPDCGAEMKDLFTGQYCPNDCDRKVTEHIDPERTQPIWLPALTKSNSTRSIKPANDPQLDLDLQPWDLGTDKNTPTISHSWYDWIDVDEYLGTD
jgi:hypothetical protein